MALNPSESTSVRVADVVSDLTSLQVCDSSAALALVSARPEESKGEQKSRTPGDDDRDPDLKRAKDLLDLHATIKLAHRDGTDQELNDARAAVQKVLRTL